MASLVADRVVAEAVVVAGAGAEAEVVVVAGAEHHATGYHNVDMQQPNPIQPYRS